MASSESYAVLAVHESFVVVFLVCIVFPLYLCLFGDVQSGQIFRILALRVMKKAAKNTSEF